MTNPLYIHLPDESSSKVELYNMKEVVLKNYRYTYMMVLKKKKHCLLFHIQHINSYKGTKYISGEVSISDRNLPIHTSIFPLIAASCKGV